MQISELYCFFFRISEPTCAIDGKIYHKLEPFNCGLRGCAECVCLKHKIRCDLTRCQNVSEHQLETVTISSNEAEQIANQSIPTLPQPDLFGDPISDYKEFTKNLYKKYTAELHNITDYSLIKDQITEIMVKRYYASKSNAPVNGAPCKENLSLSYDRFRNLSSYLAKMDYSVNNLHEKRFLRIHDKQNRGIIHSSDSYVENNSPNKQVAQSIAYSMSVQQSSSVTISKTSGFSASVGINILFISLSATYDFHKTNTEEKRSQSKSMTINAPSQKVVLDPFTKMNVTYNFYEYDTVYEYFLDFVIDEKSKMIQPDYRYIHFGDPKCCKPCLLFKTKNVVATPLNSFFKENMDLFKSIAYKNDTVIQLQQNDGKFILKNVPAFERIKNFGVDIKYGKVEKISQF